MTSLRKEGIVQVSRKGFVIRNLQALKEKVCVKENCPHCRSLKGVRQGGSLILSDKKRAPLRRGFKHQYMKFGGT
ncbi:hypothetical protein POTG_00939 [Paenibacillus sp. oral taxon 786 str. D14]|nr:hypothetical protein POTG_00939 [Paenibacillus sp. oral taxon 786 str. D14]